MIVEHHYPPENSNKTVIDREDINAAWYEFVPNFTEIADGTWTFLSRNALMGEILVHTLSKCSFSRNARLYNGLFGSFTALANAPDTKLRHIADRKPAVSIQWIKLVS